jgi:hypothetical protein
LPQFSAATPRRGRRREEERVSFTTERTRITYLYFERGGEVERQRERGESFVEERSKMSNGLMMEGFLVKEGGSIKTWKKRWCTLRDGVLSYHAKKVLPHPFFLPFQRNTKDEG